MSLRWAPASLKDLDAPGKMKNETPSLQTSVGRVWACVHDVRVCLRGLKRFREKMIHPNPGRPLIQLRRREADTDTWIRGEVLIFQSNLNNIQAAL